MHGSHVSRLLYHDPNRYHCALTSQWQFLSTVLLLYVTVLECANAKPRILPDVPVLHIDFWHGGVCLQRHQWFSFSLRYADSAIPWRNWYWGQRFLEIRRAAISRRIVAFLWKQWELTCPVREWLVETTLHCDSNFIAENVYVSNISSLINA